MQLRSGDVLLYGPSGVYGWAIRLKTWHPVAHVEVYWGDGQSTASRDGKGVGIYPFRRDKLTHILRPACFNPESASVYVQAMLGTPYGWADLLNFMGVKVDKKGIVCSPYATEVLRAGGVPVFNNEPSNDIAPFQFLLSEHLTDLPLDSSLNL